MDEEEWNEDDMKEFTRRVEHSEHAWKPAKEELEVIKNKRWELGNVR